MDTQEDDKMDTEETKRPRPKPGNSGTEEDEGILPPDELADDEGGAKGGDMENLDSWGLETDLEE